MSHFPTGGKIFSHVWEFFFPRVGKCRFSSPSKTGLTFSELVFFEFTPFTTANKTHFHSLIPTKAWATHLFWWTVTASSTKSELLATAERPKK